MMNNVLTKGALLSISAMFLLTGITLLNKGLLPVINLSDLWKGQTENKLTVTRLQWPITELQGAFNVDSLENYSFQWDGKDAFSLLLVGYKGNNQEKLNAVLFPSSSGERAVLASSTGTRQRIWQEAAQIIRKHTAPDDLILSWCDDGQRVHFLTGRNIWANKPAAESFSNKVWNSLKNELQTASSLERERLSLMAQWLTMDSGKAIDEIRKSIKPTKPIYLLVSNDMLYHLGELNQYGGKSLPMSHKTFPVGKELHGDIALIKRWTDEADIMSYLVQQEGNAYHVWGINNSSNFESNALLVRLLPFTGSFIKLPDGIRLVYQSHWSGFLSIYRIEPE